MIGTYSFTVGDLSKEFEIREGEGVLLFHFHNNGSEPESLLVGEAQVEGVLQACANCLKWVLGATETERSNGQEDQNPSED